MRNPVSRFSYSMADMNMKRSKFERSHDHKTTISAGTLYPILVDEVLPGDTYSVDLSALVRMSTPIHPVMDNAYLDTYWFFVPNRIVWDHWKEFMGESPSDPYINPIEYSVPQLISEITDSDVTRGFPVPAKSMLDYMGIPAYTSPDRINALPIRGFCKIWNEWFRDQNLQNAINIDTGDSNYYYSSMKVTGGHWDNNNANDPDAFVVNAMYGGDLPPVNKYHDYFTSALLEPQKGEPVAIPLSGFAPVYASNLINFDSQPGDGSINLRRVDNDQNAHGYFAADQGGMLGVEGSQVSMDTDVYFSNLGADLSNIAGLYSTINDLRYAFQLQKFLEADNRGGSRYREILKNHFNVTSPDASMQIPEFLGGKRLPISMSQVLQTSSTDNVSPQGNTAAFSLTTDNYSAFTKSFTEHGYIFCCACVRTTHNYQQGVERMWNRQSKFDFYFPEFANISEQPIYNREIFNPIFSTSGNYDYNGIFGYQEAWAEYRYKPNRCTAEMSSTYPQSLDVWHYGDFYQEQPYLSSEWIRETRENIDRTLAVDNRLADQFICDFYFKMNTVRIMPVYSIPGFADHH